MTQQMARDLRNILKQVGFDLRGKVQMAPSPRPIGLCGECKNEMSPHAVVFEPCGHITCTQCVDRAADTYEYIEGDDIETIFRCYACSKNVINVSYR